MGRIQGGGGAQGYHWVGFREGGTGLSLGRIQGGEGRGAQGYHWVGFREGGGTGLSLGRIQGGGGGGTALSLGRFQGGEVSPRQIMVLGKASDRFVRQNPLAGHIKKSVDPLIKCSVYYTEAVMA